MAAAVLAAIALGATVRHGWSLTCDDAFISYRYAANLADGHGAVFNSGERVEGFSNPAWVLLLAGARLVGLDVPVAARLLSLLFAVALVVGAGLLARTLLPAARGDRGAAFAAGAAAVLVALDADVGFWLTSGLETTAYAAVVLWALLLATGGLGGARVRVVGSAALCVAAATLRPDGHLVALALGALIVRGALRGEGWSRGEAWRWAVAVAAPLALFHLGRYLYFGDLLPNTWHARQGAPRPLLDGLAYLSGSLVSRGTPAAVALAGLLWGRAPVGPALWLSLLLAAGSVAVGGDWMAHGRLLVPLAAPLAAAGVAAALALAADRSRALAPALLALVAIAAWPGPRDLARIASFAGARPETAQEGTMVEAQRRAARWVAARADPGDLVAANHVGAFGYEARDLRILDMVGLTSREMARAPGAGLHRRFDLDLVLSRDPRWVVLNSRRRPEHGEYPGDYWPGETMLSRSSWFRGRCVQVHLERWTWTVHPESWVLVYRCGATALASAGPGLNLPERLGWRAAPSPPPRLRAPGAGGTTGPREP